MAEKIDVTNFDAVYEAYGRPRKDLLPGVITAAYDWDKKRSCEGKVMHTTAADALKTAVLMSTKSKDGGIYDAYKCRHCPGYHVGHRLTW